MTSEKGYADEAAYYRNLVILPDLILQCAQQDAWKYDEFSLYYRMASCSTISLRWTRGKRKGKTQVYILSMYQQQWYRKVTSFHCWFRCATALFCRNKASPDRFYINGNSRRAWTDQCLFSMWLRQFDQHISRFSGRTVLMLADNACFHGTRDTIRDSSPIPPTQRDFASSTSWRRKNCEHEEKVRNTPNTSSFASEYWRRTRSDLSDRLTYCDILAERHLEWPRMQRHSKLLA